MSVVKNPVVRSMLFVTGVISVILGVIGAFLPVLPTTPFVLLAAWCFVKSSPKTHHWLSNQPLLGKALRDWERNKSIARSTKVVAITMIIASLIFLWMKPTVIPLKIVVTIILMVVTVFLITRNEPK